MDIQDLLSKVFYAVNTSNWSLVASFLVVGAVQVYKMYSTKIKGVWAWVAAVLTGSGLGVANAAIAGIPFGGATGLLSLILRGALVGLTAAGLVKGATELGMSGLSGSK